MSEFFFSSRDRKTTKTRLHRALLRNHLSTRARAALLATFRFAAERCALATAVPAAIARADQRRGE